MLTQQYRGKVMVFDLDDTLAPEREFLRSGLRAVRRLLGVRLGRKFAAEAEKRMNDAADRRLNHYSALERMLDEHGLREKVDMKKVVDTCRNSMPDSGYRLRSDAEFLLTALRRSGVVCCLITDGRSLTQQNKIKALGLDRFFSPADILISGETGHDKHTTFPFRAVMKKYPRANGYLYIGDNPEKDFLHPRRLGWHTVMVRDSGSNISPQPLTLAIDLLGEEIYDDLTELFWKNAIKSENNQ